MRSHWKAMKIKLIKQITVSNKKRIWMKKRIIKKINKIMNLVMFQSKSKKKKIKLLWLRKKKNKNIWKSQLKEISNKYLILLLITIFRKNNQKEKKKINTTRKSRKNSVTIYFRCLKVTRMRKRNYENLFLFCFTIFRKQFYFVIKIRYV